MVTRFHILGLFIGWICCIDLAYGQTLTVYTENFPPYNMRQSGKISGVSTEIVQKILHEAGFAYNLYLQPWTRIYRAVQNTKNTLIFSMSRTKARENKFKWIADIVSTTYSVYALKNRKDIIVNQLNDLKKYRLATTQDDARESYLLSQGFQLSDFERLTSEFGHSMNLKKLMTDRVDLWPMPDAVASYVCKSEGYDIKKILKKVFILEDLSSNYWLATGLKTDDSVVSKIKKAFVKLQSSSELKQIYKKWVIRVPNL